MTYNTRSPAVKRLMKEAQELSEPTELFFAKPLDDNLFEWHFTIRGPIDTDYDGGIYHGRIQLPAEYPMKPPNILLMTPSGRFEINRKICLSISGYHPETWRPSWSIRTALLAIIGFMPTHGVGAIGSLDYPPEERRKLAKISVDFVCPQCGSIKSVLKSLTDASVADANEAKNLASQISFTGEKANEKKDEIEKSKLPEKELSQPNLQALPNFLPQPNPVITENEKLTPFPTVILQPLSFEEWCSQVKCIPKNKPKGDEVVLEQPSCSEETARSPKCSLPLTDNKSVLLETAATDVEESRQSSDTSTACLVSPVTATEVPSDNNTEEIRQRREPQINSSPSETVRPNVNTTNIDLASIRHRQSILLKCIIFVAGILGFILFARLNSLHGEINN